MAEAYDYDRLPCEPEEVLRICVNAMRFCRLRKSDKKLILKCQEDKNWHKKISNRARMKALYERSKL